MRRVASFAAAGLLAVPLLWAQAGPPREKGPFRMAELLELAKLDPSLHLDVRYASSRNFLGRPVYDEARVFLQRPAALAVLRAQQALKPRGFGLLVFDGYRPWSVTKLFWELTPADKHAFVADPREGSKHNRGCAVDISLYDLGSGAEIEMPSAYDEMSERAAARYAGGTSEQRAQRDLLRAALEHEGFRVNPTEWWHFDYKDWRHYAIFDVPFSALGETARPRP